MTPRPNSARVGRTHIHVACAVKDEGITVEVLRRTIEVEMKVEKEDASGVTWGAAPVAVWSN